MQQRGGFKRPKRGRIPDNIDIGVIYIWQVLVDTAIPGMQGAGVQECFERKCFVAVELLFNRKNLLEGCVFDYSDEMVVGRWG